jgi:hypothetical protein
MGNNNTECFRVRFPLLPIHAKAEKNGEKKPPPMVRPRYTLSHVDGRKMIPMVN